MRQFEHLFDPITVRGVSIRNRIVMAPMNTNFAAPDGSVSERFTRYYVERGRGGAGLLIVSSAYIDAAAKKRVGSLLLDDDRFIPAAKAFTAAVHATGARVLQQLNHNGRLLTSSKELKTSVSASSRIVGPSAIPHLSSGAIPHALNVGEIQELIEKFGQAARRAKEAGFDGVELHGSHGYLINQFYSRYSNRRTDGYGGSLEKRMRFPLEAYRRVRELSGDDFLVSYRINGREFAPIETPIDEVIALSQRLEQEGVDLLHVSAGNSEIAAMVLKMVPPSSTPRGCYVEYAAAIKAHVGIPVIAVGRINTPELAEQILREGKADFVAMGRALIADPYWPEKASRGEADAIRRCIACNQGCMERLAQEQPVTCLHNPEVGREGELLPAGKRKKVIVVGGGPAGMEAASVAALRGHDVELYEREHELGGQIGLTAVPPGKEEFRAVGDFLKRELARRKVPIHLNHEVTADELAQLRPDVVIVATGARPLIPAIPGADKVHVVTAWDVLEGKQVGNNVIVVGAGLVGTETALFLFEKGKRVVLIERLDDIAQDVGSLSRTRLKEHLKVTDIEVRCGTTASAIGDTALTVVDRDGREYSIPADTVVLAVGAEAEGTLHRGLQGRVSELYAIGDCVSPRKLIEAIHEGYAVALNI